MRSSCCSWTINILLSKCQRIIEKPSIQPRSQGLSSPAPKHERETRPWERGCLRQTGDPSDKEGRLWPSPSLTQFVFSSLVIRSMMARSRALSLLPVPVPTLSFISGCAIFCLSSLSSSTRNSWKKRLHKMRVGRNENGKKSYLDYEKSKQTNKQVLNRHRYFSTSFPGSLISGNEVAIFPSVRFWRIYRSLVGYGD